MNRYRIDNFQGLLLTINGPQLFEFFYKKVIENISTKNKVNWNRPWCLSGLRRYLKFKKRIWHNLANTELIKRHHTKGGFGRLWGTCCGMATLQ